MTTQKTECQLVAEEIARQISNGVKMRLGFREPMCGTENGHYLQFVVGPGRRTFKVRVTLTPADTYRVQLFKLKRADVETLADLDDVYNDMLDSVLLGIEREHLVS